MTGRAQSGLMAPVGPGSAKILGLAVKPQWVWSGRAPKPPMSPTTSHGTLDEHWTKAGIGSQQDHEAAKQWSKMSIQGTNPHVCDEDELTSVWTWGVLPGDTRWRQAHLQWSHQAWIKLYVLVPLDDRVCGDSESKQVKAIEIHLLHFRPWHEY